MFHVRTGFIVLVVGSFWSVPATAQPLGTFRWQLLPYCNVLALNIAQQGGVYTLDGTDDRCGAAQTASARGMAFLNPNGTIGFGVTMVQPGGVPVHLEAAISLPTLNGTWRDSSGASGTFVLTPGAGSGGPQRQVTASGVPPASITSIQLASGAVGAGALAANAVASGHVLDGSITTADLLDEPRAASDADSDLVTLSNNDPVTIREVTLVAPAAGRVIASASGFIRMLDNMTIDNARCAITTGTGLAIPFSAAAIERAAADYYYLPFGGTRAFNLPISATITVRLICLGSGAVIGDASLTAIFVAGS